MKLTPGRAIKNYPADTPNIIHPIYAPQVINAPWLKLSTFNTPHCRVKPSDANANIDPRTRPWIAAKNIKFNSIFFHPGLISFLNRSFEVLFHTMVGV